MVTSPGGLFELVSPPPPPPPPPGAPPRNARAFPLGTPYWQLTAPNWGNFPYIRVTGATAADIAMIEQVLQQGATTNVGQYFARQAAAADNAAGSEPANMGAFIWIEYTNINESVGARFESNQTQYTTTAAGPTAIRDLDDNPDNALAHDAKILINRQFVVSAQTATNLSLTVAATLTSGVNGLVVVDFATLPADYFSKYFGIRDLAAYNALNLEHEFLHGGTNEGTWGEQFNGHPGVYTAWFNN